MNKRDEAYWEKHFSEWAIRWRSDPLALVYDLESIMDSPCYTAREKLKLMRWAMDAYNDAAAEAYGRHRTSCPEHTED